MKRAVFLTYVVLTGATLVAPASAGAQSACEVCSAPLTGSAVVVTDWETNQEHRYHDLACAVRAMATQLPWSRAVVRSPASEQRITLTRVNTTWRAAPEDAVVIRVMGSGQGCENTIVFASAAEFREYRGKPGAQIPAGVQPTALAALPAQVLAAQPAAARTAAQAAEQAGVPQAAPAHIHPEAAASAPPAQSGLPTFSDVPADHWAAKFVEIVARLGLMEGYPDRTFRGNQPVTRYEIAAILARLAEKGGAVSAPAAAAGEPTAALPEPGGEAAPALSPPPAGVSQPAAMPSSAAAPLEETERTSLLGVTGLLGIPDARVRAAGRAVATAASIDGEFWGAIGAGVGGGIEVAAASARLAGEKKPFVSVKMRLEGWSGPGLDAAAGVTGVGLDSSVFVAATRKLQVGRNAADVTVGMGSGGVLDGVFAGAAVPVKRGLIPLAQSAQLIAESADLGHGRHFNYGVSLGVSPNLNVKFGRVDGGFAAGVFVARGL